MGEGLSFLDSNFRTKSLSDLFMYDFNTILNLSVKGLGSLSRF